MEWSWVGWRQHDRRLMPHHADRPSKICACCGRPFQWRRKWKTVWEEVRYCSNRCRSEARRPSRRKGQGPATAP
jgi:hypothetical protein